MGHLARRLNPAEIQAYDVIAPALAARVRVLRIPFIPGGYAGITIGTTIAVTCPIEDDGTSSLLAHELVHVAQWYELGPTRFLRFYLGQFVTGLLRHRSWSEAYLAIDLEVQARDGAADWCHRCASKN